MLQQKCNRDRVKWALASQEIMTRWTSRICKEQYQQNTRRTSNSVYQQAKELHKRRNTEANAHSEQCPTPSATGKNDITLRFHLTTDRMVFPQKMRNAGRMWERGVHLHCWDFNCWSTMKISAKPCQWQSHSPPPRNPVSLRQGYVHSHAMAALFMISRTGIQSRCPPRDRHT